MKTIIGNWKMMLGARESVALARNVLRFGRGRETMPNIVICPSFQALADVQKIVGRSRVKLGAQDLFWESEGAFTGEVSARQLKEVGVEYAIIGHSERRAHLGESNEMINKKLQAAINAKLIPILCIGETKKERDAGLADEVVKNQLASAVSGIKLFKQNTIYIAYEPVWAIGTGKIPSVGEIVKMHEVIRAEVDSKWGHDQTVSVHIIYGGSVDGKSAHQLLEEPAIEGLLVGGASVKISQFDEILSSAIQIK